MTMAWYLCESLAKLRKQLNEMFPDRDKKSDGSVGDTSHKRRKSSHNPNIHGAVRAIDITHNPEKGIDCRLLLTALLHAKDNRLWYLIFDKKIYNRKDNFTARPYSGLNAHKHHLHISVSDLPGKYDDDSDWQVKLNLEPLTNSQPAVEPSATTPKPRELAKNAKGDEVRSLQQKLHEKGYLKSSQIDGDFGTKTQIALQRFQLDAGLIADGIAGPKTMEKLGL